MIGVKVLIINAGSLPIPSVKGGAVENLIELAAFDETINCQNDITIVSVFDPEAEMESKQYNCDFIYVKETLLFKIFRVFRALFNKLNIFYIGNEYIYRVNKILKKQKKYYDKIVIENAPRFSLILKHKYSKELILHLHNDYLSTEEKYADKIIDEFDKIYCNSKFIIDEVNSARRNDKTELLYNGVDLNKFKKINSCDDIYRKYNLSHNDRIFVYSGRIVREKGILELVEAFNRLKFDNCKLLIIGSLNNIDRKFKKNLMKEAEKNSNIIFCGYVPHSEIQKLYSIGYFGVVPSKCNEAFGLSALEMIAMGLPVICSDDGALPEVVSSDCGMIVDKNNLVLGLSDAIVSAFYMNDSDYKILSNNAVKSAGKFSSKQYINDFKKMIS